MKSSIGIAASVSYLAVPREPSSSETRLIVCRADGEPQVTDFSPANHLGENVELFAAAALGREKFPIDAAGILQTVAALDAVFRSVDADGAWQVV